MYVTKVARVNILGYTYRQWAYTPSRRAQTTGLRVVVRQYIHDDKSYGPMLARVIEGDALDKLYLTVHVSERVVSLRDLRVLVYEYLNAKI